ncbi:BTB/POZ domain-containing protein POB1 isoform X3 [Triticum aestivum]|uniref:BTB/POZ domain-containing protein POB1 isoform X3 n=1 Tax=Triticum aestivum TaxID=4565 RepID=UPI001D01FC3D|nr:BTB/POZ domain-containing protein POB1-like isoform X3 [Triticum aestivum]
MASTGAEVDAGFEFAFDNEIFSDKVLRIEVAAGSGDAPGSDAGAASRKRRREGDEGDDEEGIDSSCTVMGTPILQVKTIHVSSVILAAKSSFFLKLFSNGMKESGQREATVRLADSEEKAFMELLRFMYMGKLTPTTEPTHLVDILMAADKFEAISCMKLCVPAVLTEAVMKFLAERYKEFLSTESQDELMRIPGAGIEAILRRNSFGFASEVAVYDFVLRWTCYQCPNSEEIRKFSSNILLPVVQQMHMLTNAFAMFTNAIAVDHPSGIINFTINREKCFSLFPSGSMNSLPFHCGDHVFYLSACCAMKEQLQYFYLGIQVLTYTKGAARGAIDYKFEAKRTPSLEFVTMFSRTINSDSRVAVRCKFLWSQFIADNNPFFVEDKLHLRVHVTTKPLQP